MKTLALLIGLASGLGAQTLIGWNNLGMHCMDDDYSVFSILPPYNTFDAQFIDAGGHLVTDTSGLVVTYEAIGDPDGSINTTSTGKTNFWNYTTDYFGVALPSDTGLTGKTMPGAANTPQFMDFDGVMNWFEGAGVPITATDDSGHRNSYPMMRLTAKTPGGTVLATTDIVLPVSTEMDCRKCHGSGTGPAAMPAGGWVNDPHPSRDYRLNILRLHDERHLGTEPYTGALADRGYPPEGLEASVMDHNHPVLCAACHASEALGAPSYPGVKPLTESMHGFHAGVVSPDNGMSLNANANRSSCYQCHPGSDTRCLRGAMGSAVAADGSASMQCQSCHGNMSAVGDPGRTGWLDEPNCGSCHQNSERFTSVFLAGGGVRPPAGTFASPPDTPAPGISLYRFSAGHGGLQCSACHGSTHAVYPSIHRNDNLQNSALQGHAGTIANCTSCHSSMPVTVNGGPHGMHPTGDSWVRDHHDFGQGASCQACHGSDLRGSPLSRTFDSRTLTARNDGTTQTFEMFRGETVSCFICHRQEDDGGIGGLFNNNAPPVVPDSTLITSTDTPGATTLTASDANGQALTLRIVHQPHHGTVALTGTLATYFPDPGFSGPDSFTYAAFDGFRESNLGTVSVTVGDPLLADTLDTDLDGLPDVIEYLLGFDPGFPTAPGVRVPAIRDVGGTNYYTYRISRAPAPADGTVVVEFTSDFVTWVPGVILTDTPFLLDVRDPDPASLHQKRFARIRGER
ncbi:Ig-like domain-containing protein [Haloferula helveola]